MHVSVGVGREKRELHPNILYMQISLTMGNKYLTLFLPTFVGENPQKSRQILSKSNNICIELKTCKVTEYELNRKPQLCIKMDSGRGFDFHR